MHFYTVISFTFYNAHKVYLQTHLTSAMCRALLEELNYTYHYA